MAEAQDRQLAEDHYYAALDLYAAGDTDAAIAKY